MTCPNDECMICLNPMCLFGCVEQKERDKHIERITKLTVRIIEAAKEKEKP